MEPPPPYSAIDGDLRRLRDGGVLLERKVTRVIGIAESLKDWEKVIEEKKEKGASVIDQWKEKTIEIIEKKYQKLVENLNQSIAEEKAKLHDSLSAIEELINSALYLRESIDNVIKHRKEHDVESTKIRLEGYMSRFELYNSPQTWKPSLSKWVLNRTPEGCVNEIKLETQPADKSEFSSYSEIRTAPLPSLPKRQSGGPLEHQSYIFQYSFQTKTYNDKARCHPQSFAMRYMDIVVPDENNKIIKIFSIGGHLKRTISHPRLLVPGSLCVTKKGYIAVIDSSCKDIKFFDEDGVLVGVSPTLPGPSCIACNSKNQLVIADMAYKAIYTLTETGCETVSTIQYYTAQAPYDPKTTQEYPYFRAPHYVCVSPTDQIIVSDRAAGSVLMFEADGTYIDTFGLNDAIEDPYGVSCDPCGNILVTENSKASVTVVDSTVTPLLTHSKHDISSPTMAVICEDESILVGEYLSGLIKVFAPQGVNPSGPPDLEPPPPAYDDVFGCPILSGELPAYSGPSQSPTDTWQSVADSWVSSIVTAAASSTYNTAAPSAGTSVVPSSDTTSSPAAADADPETDNASVNNSWQEWTI